ncbi:FMN-binding glutamate synthase family protein [Marinobacteraceae bacterium S3BR75-40.1]
MRPLHTLVSRYTPYALSVLGLVITAPLAWFYPSLWLLPLLFGVLTAVGTHDIFNRHHTISRNYPIAAHLRYILEGIGPELRQYFIHSDTEEQPFSREQRAIVYRRAKNVLDKKPFGSLHAMYEPGYEWMSHSLAPVDDLDPDFRVTIGENCKQPYSASVLNISAMSFGALSANAILALNAGAAKGGFYHDTGEGSISRYHLQYNGDLVWEIGSGYFGCRNPDGSFSEEAFVRNATRDQVKMIEIKLSQGAKPGHGGILPGAKVTEEIAEARGVAIGEDCVSPPSHSAFSTPLELMDFIERLRDLSGGKPVGFKLAIGHPWEWFALVKAMLESHKLPDFIVVDGGEGGTGAAPLEFINRLGMPLSEALLLVHNTLVATNLREKIKIGAAGKITTAFYMARVMALGADWCNAARGFMFSLGCIQSQNCHNDSCPSGVATQNPYRSRNLDVKDKSERVYNFHRHTVQALANLIGAAGLRHSDELGPEHINHRISRTKAKSYADIYHYLEPGELLEGVPDHPLYREFWETARADSFAPPEFIRELRRSKLR